VAATGAVDFALATFPASETTDGNTGVPPARPEIVQVNVLAFEVLQVLPEAEA
jgi:hypothetical protein